MSAHEKLQKLHEKLTDVYTEILDTAQEESGTEEEDTPLGFLLSPAMLTSAANFLKQNDITVQVEEGDAMSDLQKKLKEKQRQGKAKLHAVGD